MPDALQNLGIDQVVISGLDFIPAKRFETEALPLERQDKDLSRTLNFVKTEAQAKGLNVHYNLRKSDSPSCFCSENPQRAIFVSSDGMISPCVFTNLPVTNTGCAADDDALQYTHIAFGDIKTHSLTTIWQGRDYVQFRQSFDAGQFSPICRNCRKLCID
jgi:MoaA/NifB/PqqE/SkfB family radical SAM enzyme